MARYAAIVFHSLFLVAALSAQPVELVDIEAVRATGEPASFVHAVPAAQNPPEAACDILVAGAGAGGFAAALGAARRGHTVCLTEESSWIGGQTTAGGVSALDENKFMEFAGGTRSYYEFRNRIRGYYRRQFTLSPAAAALENFNPGSCYVSPLCFEPKAGLEAHQQMLRPFERLVRLMLRTRVYQLAVRDDAVHSALAYNFETRQVTRIRPRWVLDATETGELLPLAGVPYTVGSEAAADTGEPHAAAAANAACVQSFTYPFAIDVRPGENHRGPKPPGYEHFRDSQPFSFRINYAEDLGWRGLVEYKMFGEDPPIPNNMSPGPFFTWRRLLATKNFTGPNAPADLALINWPRQDYHDESLLDRTPLDAARILQQAKRVALAFLYWLQTDVPRDDGNGKGYPELRLRPDVMGTGDGLSKVPYIRESRRILPRGTRVVEQDIVDAYQPGVRARWFDDSVGIGFYMVDIHPCGANERGRMMMPRPFQIPLGALLPRKLRNFLPAAKNLGVTHLTNGAFRLHPVEWNTGEAAAMYASLALSQQAAPAATQVQRELAKAGVPLVWFDDLRMDHPAFSAIHYTAIRGIYPVGRHDLHASPEAPVTRAEAAAALAAYFNVATTQPAQLALQRGWMAVDHRNWFHPDLPFYWTDWREDKFPRPVPATPIKRTGPVTRAELALRLAQ